MRTFKQVLWPILLGVVVWAVVSYNSNRTLTALGIKGGNNVRNGNEGSLAYGFYLFIAFCAATILNGVLGYCLAKTGDPRRKTALTTLTVLLIFGVSMLANYWVYIADVR